MSENYKKRKVTEIYDGEASKQHVHVFCSDCINEYSLTYRMHLCFRSKFFRQMHSAASAFLYCVGNRLCQRNVCQGECEAFT